MSQFDEHDRSFEAKFAQDEEMLFRILARRNRLLGEWAAQLMGLSEAEAAAYSKDLVRADFEGGGGKDVLYGGACKDLFAFRALSEAGDSVKDLAKGEDLLDLRTLMKAMNVTHDPVAAGIVKFAAAGAGTVVSIDADGAGAGTPVTLVTIENTKIGASDYLWH